MVGGRRNRARVRKLLGSHQKCWLWGRHAVLEMLRAGYWRPLEIWIAEQLDPELRQDIEAACQRAEIPIVIETGDRLTQRCGTAEHQGLLAQLPPFPYRPLDDILPRLGHHAAFVLVLDCVQDPYNFGAILRSAEVFGAQAVIVADQQQAEVSVLVARSSAGAVNYVPLVQVADLVDAVHQLQQRGCRVVAAAEQATQAVSEADFSGATAVVIGNEGAGVRDAVLAACDAMVRIPQVGHIRSLNAAVAAGILCYEVRRQRASQSTRRKH